MSYLLRKLLLMVMSITNQAELDYAETLIETDGTPANYIITEL